MTRLSSGTLFRSKVVPLSKDVSSAYAYEPVEHVDAAAAVLMSTLAPEKDVPNWP